MKTILLVLACVALSVHASTLGIMTVKMPVYMHSDGDPMIDIMDVPVLCAGALPESRYSAITHSFSPTSVSDWVKTSNANVAAEYGIHASMEEKGEDLPHWIITVDASAAKRPEGYPFTIEQVTDAVVTCVKLMTPAVPEDERKVTIKVLPPKAGGKGSADTSKKK